MTGTLLTVVAGLGFFAWVIAVFAAIQLVRLAPKGEKLKTYGKLGWWQFDEIRKTIGPAADQPIRVYQRAFIAFIGLVFAAMIAGVALGAMTQN